MIGDQLLVSLLFCRCKPKNVFFTFLTRAYLTFFFPHYFRALTNQKIGIP